MSQWCWRWWLRCPLMWITPLITSNNVQGNSGTPTCRRPTPYSTDTNQCGLPVARNYTLSWIDPGKVGRSLQIQTYQGVSYKLLTVARDPPIYEIPDFLTPDECVAIIQQARDNGLRSAKQMGAVGNKQSDRSSGRVAQTTFISRGRHLQAIRYRVSMLTGIPYDLVRESEPIQVVMYSPGGYYHSHFDSVGEEVTRGERPKPCCHNTWFPHTRQRCNLCRYLTVLLYLNNVKQGGETAFPVADHPTQDFKISKAMTNLSENCQRAPVVVRPERGKAVLWYNHYKDRQNGWLGSLNRLSLHGGCDVVQGEKWIANVWINAARQQDKDKYSIFSERWD